MLSLTFRSPVLSPVIPFSGRMLRRYSSRGVDTIGIDSRRTIGHHNCDINIEVRGQTLYWVMYCISGGRRLLSPRGHRTPPLYPDLLAEGTVPDGDDDRQRQTCQRTGGVQGTYSPLRWGRQGKHQVWLRFL